MMRALAILVCMGFPGALWAQGNSVTVGGMEFSYRLLSDSVEITLTAPTSGWVGVGFCEQNNIVGSDLYLFHVVAGQAEGLDMYVVSAGNPQEDSELGGVSTIRNLSGQERQGNTTVHFTLPLQSGDRYDFSHSLNEEFWLILAYSTHDDFGHHSRMRKHLRYQFEPD